MKINLTIPQHWNQLSATQAQNICHALHINQYLVANKHNAEIINSVTFFNIAKELLRGNSFKNIRIVLKEIRVNAFQPFVDFIFNKEVNLTQFPELKKTKLLGPAQRLSNITIAELSYADALYYRWQTTKDVNFLNRLCATLYRPQLPETTLSEDSRQPFSKLLIAQNVEAITSLDLKVKLVVAFAYEGSRNYMVNQYPNVFPKSQAKPDVAKAPAKYTPFGELIAVKIEHDPSKLEQVEKMNAYKFLNLYELELREQKKRKKFNKK